MACFQSTIQSQILKSLPWTDVHLPDNTYVVYSVSSCSVTIDWRIPTQFVFGDRGSAPPLNGLEGHYGTKFHGYSSLVPAQIHATLFNGICYGYIIICAVISSRRVKPVHRSNWTHITPYGHEGHRPPNVGTWTDAWPNTPSSFSANYPTWDWSRYG